MGRTKFTTSGAHDVIAITSLRKNDLCTEKLREKTNAPINGMPHLPLLGTTAGIDRVFVSQFLPHPWGAPGQ